MCLIGVAHYRASTVALSNGKDNIQLPLLGRGKLMERLVMVTLQRTLEVI